MKAVENAAPCEDTTRISYGGVVYHLSVDVAPQRRIDLAIRHITEGATVGKRKQPEKHSGSSRRRINLGSQQDIKSAGVAKRNEIERVAQSSR